MLALREIALDCDGDALLLTVDPVGPTCHRGTRSCFDPLEGDGSADTARSQHRPPSRASPGSSRSGRRSSTGQPAGRPGSYTARLLEGGVDAVGRKVTEEATEVLLAAKDDAVAQAAGADRAGTRAALAGEAADLVYHSLVLLAERDLAPNAVIAALRARHPA